MKMTLLFSTLMLAILMVGASFNPVRAAETHQWTAAMHSSLPFGAIAQDDEDECTDSDDDGECDPVEMEE